MNAELRNYPKLQVTVLPIIVLRLHVEAGSEIVLLRPETTACPAKQTSSGILCERVPCLTALNGDIGVANDRGGEENRTTWQELDDHLGVPQDNMTSLLVVIVAQSGDGAQTKCEVEMIEVNVGDCARAEIECCGSEDIVDKIATQRRVRCKKCIHGLFIVLVDIRSMSKE